MADEIFGELNSSREKGEIPSLPRSDGESFPHSGIIIRTMASDLRSMASHGGIPQGGEVSVPLLEEEKTGGTLRFERTQYIWFLVVGGSLGFLAIVGYLLFLIFRD